MFGDQTFQLLAEQSGLAVDAGQEFRVKVVYSGPPEVIPVPGLPVEGIGWMHEGELIITMSEPTGAMSWYPCIQPMPSTGRPGTGTTSGLPE